MKKTVLGFILSVACVFASFARAADAPYKFKIKDGTATITGKRDKAIRILADGVDAKAGLIWRYDKAKLDTVSVSKTEKYFVGPPGTYTIEVWSLLLDKDGATQTDEATITLKIEGSDPTPDPGPTPPGPTPPGPTPDPPAPIAGAGLKMLIIEESADRSKLPPGQQRILTSKVLRDYLRSKAVPSTDGDTNFRIFDKDTDMAGESKTWGDAMKRGLATKGFATPWIIVSNGKTGYEGALPATFDDAMTLLKKYGDK